jgi:hypothetical protein
MNESRYWNRRGQRLITVFATASAVAYPASWLGQELIAGVALLVAATSSIAALLVGRRRT